LAADLVGPDRRPPAAMALHRRTDSADEGSVDGMLCFVLGPSASLLDQGFLRISRAHAFVIWSRSSRPPPPPSSQPKPVQSSAVRHTEGRRGGPLHSVIKNIRSVPASNSNGHPFKHKHPPPRPLHYRERIATAVHNLRFKSCPEAERRSPVFDGRVPFELEELDKLASRSSIAGRPVLDDAEWPQNPCPDTSDALTKSLGILEAVCTCHKLQCSRKDPERTVPSAASTARWMMALSRLVDPKRPGSWDRQDSSWGTSQSGKRRTRTGP